MLFQRYKQFGRAVEHVQRYRTIVSVFLKYGYEDVARKLPLPSALRWPFRELRETQEIRVLKILRQFPHMVTTAASNLEPTILVDYLKNLATVFHQFYTVCRVVTDDMPVTQARLSLVYAVQHVLKKGLNLLGVSAPDKM